MAQRGQESGVDHVERSLHHLIRHAEGRGAGAIKAQAVVTQGLVATRSHVIDDTLGILLNRAGQGTAALQIIKSQTSSRSEANLSHAYSLLLAARPARRSDSWRIRGSLR